MLITCSAGLKNHIWRKHQKRQRTEVVQVEQPGDDPAEQPGDDPAEQPGDDRIEQPGDDRVDNPVERVQTYVQSCIR